MAKADDGATLRQVRTLFEAGAVGGLSDRQLLERFRTREGEAAEQAFAALVGRHGPMVLRICQRALRDAHGAQDAFQATFLVLVRKAGALRVHDSLGPWLHAVACRVAACARTAEARRRAHELKAAERASLVTERGGWDDLGQVLHEEIDRLPATFRAAVVLCDLEGLTQEQAAQRLGWPSGTVRSRLARGRGRLRARLTRRGLAPSAGAFAALLSAEAATAAVPPALVQSACRAATLVAAGQVATEAVSVAALTEGVMRAMFMTRLKLLAVAVLTVSTGATCGAVLAFPQASGPADGAPARGSAPDRDPFEDRTRKYAQVKASIEEAPQERQADDVPERQDAVAALADVDRAMERLVWSRQMFASGYLSQAQLTADETAVHRARMALERRVKRRELPGTPSKTKTADERKHDEDSATEQQRKATEALLQFEKDRLKRAETRAKILPLDKEPSALSEAERKRAEAEVAAAAAECALKQAELRVIEIRLRAAKP